MTVSSGSPVWGTILSGESGTRPDLVPFKYIGETTVYQIPYPTDANLNTVGFKISSKEESRQAQIIENQLIGGTRPHLLANSFVVFDGVYTDKSNHPANNLIIAVSGLSAFINNAYVGEKIKEYSWSGLDHSNTNYLFINSVEQSTETINGLSSVRYRDFETRSNITGADPVQNSLLVATFVSGVGINQNPIHKMKMTSVADHRDTILDPHGSYLLQDTILVSGFVAQSQFNLSNLAITSGVLSGTYDSVTYLQDLTFNDDSLMLVSGIEGNLLSGNLVGTFYDGATVLDVDVAYVGNLIVVSGLDNSGLGTNLFRNHLHLRNGANIDGFNAISGVPLISQAILSGNPPLHKHGLDIDSGINVMICPQYPGTVFDKPVNPTGLGTSYPFEYTTGFCNFIPILRHKAQTDSLVYIRGFVPTGYNELKSVETQYRIDSGSRPIEFKVRDCTGNLLQPRLGFVLSSSGLHTITTSGFSQVNFSENMAFDLEYQFRAISGTNQYLGPIICRFSIKPQ